MLNSLCLNVVCIFFVEILATNYIDNIYYWKPFIICFLFYQASDAASLFEAAQNKLQSGKYESFYFYFYTFLEFLYQCIFLASGFLSESHGIMVEALNFYHQVYGPLHSDIAVCYRYAARHFTRQKNINFC
jgi:hypothetical protein